MQPLQFLLSLVAIVLLATGGAFVALNLDNDSDSTALLAEDGPTAAGSSTALQAAPEGNLDRNQAEFPVQPPAPEEESSEEDSGMPELPVTLPSEEPSDEETEDDTPSLPSEPPTLPSDEPTTEDDEPDSTFTPEPGPAGTAGGNPTLGGSSPEAQTGPGSANNGGDPMPQTGGGLGLAALAALGGARALKRRS